MKHRKKWLMVRRGAGTLCRAVPGLRPKRGRGCLRAASPRLGGAARVHAAAAGLCVPAASGARLPCVGARRGLRVVRACGGAGPAQVHTPGEGRVSVELQPLLGTCQAPRAPAAGGARRSPLLEVPDSAWAARGSEERTVALPAACCSTASIATQRPSSSRGRRAQVPAQQREELCRTHEDELTAQYEAEAAATHQPQEAERSAQEDTVFKQCARRRRLAVHRAPGTSTNNTESE